MSLKTLTKQNFEQEILNQKGIALVDFYATWCGPCKMLSPVVDEIAEEHTEIAVGKVNVDDESDLATAYGVMSIPTLIVFKDGALVSRSVGYRSKEEILATLV